MKADHYNLKLFLLGTTGGVLLILALTVVLIALMANKKSKSEPAADGQSLKLPL